MAHRRKSRELVAAFIEEVADRSGMTLRLPASTLASIILAAADGLTTETGFREPALPLRDVQEGTASTSFRVLDTHVENRGSS